LQGNGFAVSGVAKAKMTFSDVCFTDNELIGSGVVVIEGSIEDFTSSNVSGTVDPTLECPFASIGFGSCVDYDSDTCSASNPSDVTNPSVPSPTPASAPVAATAPTLEGNTSDSFPIRTTISFVLLLVSVVLAL
jgi:hypothetical protein